CRMASRSTTALVNDNKFVLFARKLPFRVVRSDRRASIKGTMTLDPLDGEGRAREENRELSPTKPRRSRLCPARAGSVVMNALHAEHSPRESHAVSSSAKRGLLINIDNGG